MDDNDFNAAKDGYWRSPFIVREIPTRIVGWATAICTITGRSAWWEAGELFWIAVCLSCISVITKGYWRYNYQAILVQPVYQHLIALSIKRTSGSLIDFALATRKALVFMFWRSQILRPPPGLMSITYSAFTFRATFCWPRWGYSMENCTTVFSMLSSVCKYQLKMRMDSQRNWTLVCVICM